MKKYIYLIAITFFISMSAQAQKVEKNVKDVLSVFPYQHSNEVVDALTTMGSWKSTEWKLLFKMLDDDSLQLKATYALNAYVHIVSLENAKKAKAVQLLKKQLKKASTNYATTLINAQIGLLSDESLVTSNLQSLPSLPKVVTTKQLQQNSTQQLLQLQDQMDHVIANGNIFEKKSILIQASKIPSIGAFVFVSKFLGDAAVQKDAALIITRLALANNGIGEMGGPLVRQALEQAEPLISGEDSALLVPMLKAQLKKMPYDYGFVSLFNGKDLTGWKGLVANPIARGKMSESEIAAAQQKANSTIQTDWIIKDGLLVFTGHGDNLCTEKQYGDMEMFVDWKITEKGDAGIYLRGTPQVQIWDTSRREVGAQVGSGGLYNNQKNQSKPLLVADNKVGEWNTFHIIMKDDKVTVYLNGILVTDHISLENYWDRKLPLFSKEQIELQAHGTYVAYRNIYIRELPTYKNILTSLNDIEKQEGFVQLFDGTNMDNWIGNFSGYLSKDGAIEVNPNSKGGGNLYTKEEYSDFVYRFEFQLTPGANNGIGIHAPLEGDAAYVGMEIQVLDSEHPMYANLKPYQYHGSVYGIVPAKRGFLKPTGEWNQEEIMIQGSKIKVTLNGTVITEADLKEATKNGTMDHNEHPGLKNTTGHIGFLGHGDVVRFKNIRIKKLANK
ncbi:MAG: 3-keto-disaccharide hydrolase [Sediminibacterium sp.]